MGCIFLPLTLLCGCLCIYFLVGITRQGLARWKGTRVEGRINNRWIVGGGRGGSFYKVSYSYTIAGRAYFQKQYVSTEHYADFDTNTDVQVLCLANYPTVAILAEDNGNFLYFAFCTIMLFGLTVFMILQALR